MLLSRPCRLFMALALAGCGAPPTSAPPPVAQAAPPPPPPADHVALDVYVDGVPAGHEAWDVTKNGDGTTDVAFQSVMEDKGAKISGSGSLHLMPDLTTGAAEITLDTRDGSVKGELRTSGNAMALTLSRGDESRAVRAEKPSNLFLPQPFFVGFAKLCPLFDAGRGGLVEFPGSPMTLGEKRTLGASEEAKGVTVYTVERGGLGKTLVACEKGELVAALDPWSGESVARSGRKSVLDAMVAMTTRPKPKTPDAIVEDDLTVTVSATQRDGEAKLACSFMRPAPLPTTRAKTKPVRFPTVVFLSGSGAQDRDEDTTGPGGVKLSLFKVLAIALAEKGVASVRCDDRGTGRSTGTFDQATLSTFVRDAEEVVHAMYARADVDPLRIGLIGHSEGGMVAPVVVHGEPKIRSVVLMAAPGRPIPDIAVVQQHRLLEQAGLPKEQIEKQLAAQAEVLAAIRKGDPLPPMVPPSERARIEAQRAWLKSHFDHDPQQALKEMPATAVLVAQGAKDLQVPVEEAELVRKGLSSGKNGNAKVIVYPTLNHLFVEAKDDSLSEYSDPRTVIDPTFVSDTVSFLVAALTAK